MDKKLKSQIQKLVIQANGLILSAVDDNGDKIHVIDPTSTWQEPMEYDTILFSNNRLYIYYYEPYSNKNNSETISAANMEFDGVPALMYIIKLYKSALKKHGLLPA
jgi:hypothetical protein